MSVTLATTMVAIAVVLAPAAVASAALVVAVSIMPGAPSLIATAMAPTPATITVVADVYSASPMRPGVSSVCWWGMGCRILTPLGRRGLPVLVSVLRCQILPVLPQTWSV